MSHFQFPRIHVAGQFWFNPATGNNDSIDPMDSGVPTVDTEAVWPLLGGMTDAEFSRWMQELQTITYPDGSSRTMLRSQWNYYGDMAFRFMNVRVVSVQPEPDILVTDPARESLIGAEVSMNNGFMLDIDPEGFSTSQIFCDNIGWKGSTDALGLDGTWYSRKPSKAVTRWINWYRNLYFHGLPDSSGAAGGVSASFQMAIPILEDDLPGDPTQQGYDDDDKRFETGNSPVMLRLIEALKEGVPAGTLKGLIFRLNLYLAYPLIDDLALAAQFAAGLQTENPAIGKMVGTFGLWHAGDLQSITMGRYLNWKNGFQYPTQPAAQTMRTAYLCPTVAQVDTERKIVTLDLANVFPEQDQHGTKYDMGPMQLGYHDGAAVQPVGPLRYDQEYYESRGGMVDIPYPAEKEQALLHGDLVIGGAAPGMQELLRESPYMAAADDACVYLNEAGPENRRIRVRLMFRGRGLAEDVGVTAQEWKLTPTYDAKTFPVPALSQLLSTTELAFPAGGPYSEVSFLLATHRGPGGRVFRFVPPDYTPPPPPWAPKGVPQPNIVIDYMCSVRVLPLDDFSRIPDSELTWELIYDKVFRYHYLVYPGMNKHLDLSDPSIWTTPTAAQYMLKRSSKEYWWDYYYMPRSRDLSDGKRELLQRWLRTLIPAAHPSHHRPERHGKGE
jgi:hypothetical protein